MRCFGTVNIWCAAGLSHLHGFVLKSLVEVYLPYRVRPFPTQLLTSIGVIAFSDDTLHRHILLLFLATKDGNVHMVTEVTFLALTQHFTPSSSS